MDPEIIKPAPILSGNIPILPVSAPRSKLPLIFWVIFLLGVSGVVGILWINYLSGPKSSTSVQTVISPTPTLTCGSCPQFTPPNSDFCKDGTIIPGGIDECGCQKLPTCKKIAVQDQTVNFVQNKWLIKNGKNTVTIPLTNNSDNKEVILHGQIFTSNNHLYLSYSVGAGTTYHNEKAKHYFTLIDLNSSQPQEKLIKEQGTTSPLSFNVPVSLSPNESYLLYISYYEFMSVPLYTLNIKTGNVFEVPVTVNLEYRNYSWSPDEKYFDFEYYKLEDPNPPVKFSSGKARFFPENNQLIYP